MTDAKEVPICTCNDDWHAYNAENHAPTCPVIAAFATLTRERDEARKVTDAMINKGWSLLQKRCIQDYEGILVLVVRDDFADALTAALSEATP
jgi:hypothetical protein